MHAIRNKILKNQYKVESIFLKQENSDVQVFTTVWVIHRGDS